MSRIGLRYGLRVMLLADGNTLEKGQQRGIAATGVDDFDHRIELLTAEYPSREVSLLAGVANDGAVAAAASPVVV